MEPKIESDMTPGEIERFLREHEMRLGAIEARLNRKPGMGGDVVTITRTDYDALVNIARLIKHAPDLTAMLDRLDREQGPPAMRTAWCGHCGKVDNIPYLHNQWQCSRCGRHVSQATRPDDNVEMIEGRR